MLQKNNLLEAALKSIKTAYSVCSDIQKKLKSSDSYIKSDKTPVTIADYCSQAVISIILNKLTPDVPILAEEDVIDLNSNKNSDIKKNILSYVKNIFPDFSDEAIIKAIGRGGTEQKFSDKFWVLDPVDGTKGFLRNGQYAIALALIEKGTVEIGVLGCPNLPENLKNPEKKTGVIFFAEKGKGSKMFKYSSSADHNIKPIKVSSRSKISDVSAAVSYESSHTNESFTETFLNNLGITDKIIKMDSQCKYALLASAQTDIYFRMLPGKNSYEKIWDHAAGTLIVKEAGGIVTDFNGKPIDFSQGKYLNKNCGILATNGFIHEEILKITKKIFLK